mmetsp:Transcript_15746/g.34157  ORF Transcript_15746/g.34157 Transcript_15746/m.34157 type:complete len:308 (+) Transcript_15746:595-1518(+)
MPPHAPFMDRRPLAPNERTPPPAAPRHVPAPGGPRVQRPLGDGSRRLACVGRFRRDLTLAYVVLGLGPRLRDFDSLLAAVVQPDLIVVDDAVVHLHQQVWRLEELDVGERVAGLPKLESAVAELGGAQGRIGLVITDATDHELGHRVEGELRGLAAEDVGDAADDVGGRDGGEVGVEGEERDGLLGLAAGKHGRTEVAHAVEGVDKLVDRADGLERLDKGSLHVRVVTRVEEQLHLARGQLVLERDDQVAHERALCTRAADWDEQAGGLLRGSARLACGAVGRDVDDQVLRDPRADKLDLLGGHAHP